MTGKPAYFETIRSLASRRWDQLEQDPELAGPWHQLFRQVQIPRHVLSELLQNADDAMATEASVAIRDDVFTFSHNGEDFAEEHFASLCRFGYSNKRALHTIGFRGIGFKSTFSLGDSVELHTPTLSISFDRKRFTEPKWTDWSFSTEGRTEIRVKINDKNRQREIAKNLEEWRKSPISLLFFRRLRQLRIADCQLDWMNLGPGPVSNSHRMALRGNLKETFLLVNSLCEKFPPEAIDEIRQERLIADEEDFKYPPCSVEIVLGATGRLYVVLPTGVETVLPFAANAPFIQDPARIGIKGPETSATNQWLLGRVGELAESAMMEWLGNNTLSVIDRAQAYGFLPNVDREDNSLEGLCAGFVEESFDSVNEGAEFLLTHSGDLATSGQAVVIPEELCDVWPEDRVASLLDDGNRPSLSRYVCEQDREKLIRWGFVTQITAEQVFSVLQTESLPTPATWGCLLKLWAFVSVKAREFRFRSFDKRRLKLVPVQGSRVLRAANETIRLSQRKLLQSKADLEFLAAYLHILDARWTRYLIELAKNEDSSDHEALPDDVEAAMELLEDLDLKNASDVSLVIKQVAEGFFKRDEIETSDCVKLAHIAAKLGATPDKSFYFVTHDDRLRSVEDGIVWDKDGKLEDYLPEYYCSPHLLHELYTSDLASCDRDEWTTWVLSGRSQIFIFPPLVERNVKYSNREHIEDLLRERGLEDNFTYRFSIPHYSVEDWDFEDALWKHWESLASHTPRFWGRLFDLFLRQPDSAWLKAMSAKAHQLSATGAKHAITTEPIAPGWILKLRELPCLPDTRGVFRKPSDLLRRTLETESLIDVEPFIDGRLDTESVRPLLDLLGVRDTPTGPDRLLDCLRALSRAVAPPVQEVEKWYRRLDQMMDTCSTDDLANIKTAFAKESIILTEDSEWTRASGVFLAAEDDDVPGASVIRRVVADLALWRKIGIAERPTADLAIRWLNTLASGKRLPEADVRRVRALISRHPARIWNECGQWLSLAGEWAAVETLKYSLTMQTLVPWSHLHDWVKQATADLQRLTVDVTEKPPFSDLRRLGNCIEDRFQQGLEIDGRRERQSWLNAFGDELQRIKLDDDSETERVKGLAAKLAETEWQTSSGLKMVPYIDGKPCGLPKLTDAVWIETTLYVERLSQSKLARIVPDRIGKRFGRDDVTAALNYAFARSINDVQEYMRENFDLLPIEFNRLLGVESSQEPILQESRAVATEPTEFGQWANNQDCVASDEQFSATVDASATQFPGMGQRASSEVAVDKDDARTMVLSEGENETNNGTVAEEILPIGNAVTESCRQVSDGLASPPPRNRAQPKPSIMELFARTQGFKKDESGGFLHSDGSRLRKDNEETFHWVKWTANGEVSRYYLPLKHCLERDPLEIEVEAWDLIESAPQIHSLVLLDPEGEPVEVSGELLQSMKDASELTLFPAAYRLVVTRGRKL